MEQIKSLTDIAGLRVGHAQDEEALTGCTVILCEDGAVGGVDQRGGAPGTRETDALHPLHLVQQVHAVVLTGGSAFGLEAATGVVRYLEERGVGFDTGIVRVPIVPAAVLYDLGIGRADVRPDAAMGYRACVNASSEAIIEGNVGAGCGATVGKILGMPNGMKSGLGSAGIEITDGLVVCALAVVNALGNVINPESGQIIAGARLESPSHDKKGGYRFADALQVLRMMAAQDDLEFRGGSNTVIGVVATNAALTKEQANIMAQMAQDGIARTILPAHTMLDGDTIFALSYGKRKADINTIGAFAAEAFAQAVLSAVRTARPAGGLPGLGE